VALAALGCVALLAACSSSGSGGTRSSSSAQPSTQPSAAATGASADLQALYKKAKAAGETEVTIYQAANPVFEPIRQAFDKAFPGITANGVSIIGAAQQSRLQAEFSTGKHAADLVLSGPTDLVPEAAHGWMQSYLPTGAKTLPASYIGPNKAFLASSVQLYGFVYNKQDVSASDVPTSWSDVLSAKWKGKVGLEDPTASNGSTGALLEAAHAKVFDKATLQKFKNLDPKIYAAEASLVNAVATGEVQIGMLISYDQYKTAADKGAPIGFSGALKEGNPMQPLFIGLVKHAPHPDAAKLYESWLLSPSGQAQTASLIAQYGTVPGSPAPKGAPQLSGVKQLGLPPFDQLNQAFNSLLAQTKSIFK
jgi:iron(III) transport system substrate-binding protein